MRVTASYNSASTQHAYDTDGWAPGPPDTRRTLCGRDAGDWMDIGDMPDDKFQDSAYSCKRCVKLMHD